MSQERGASERGTVDVDRSGVAASRRYALWDWLSERHGESFSITEVVRLSGLYDSGGIGSSGYTKCLKDMWWLHERSLVLHGEACQPYRWAITTAGAVSSRVARGRA